MPRNKLGQRLQAHTRLIVAPTGPVMAADGKLDVSPTIAKMDLGADPLLLEVHVPAYDPATYNELTSVSVVFMPTGSDEPATADDFLASGHPMATVGLAPASTATASVAAAPVVAAPVVAAPVAAAAPVTSPVVAAPATATVSGTLISPPHVAATATAAVKAPAVASPYLPGPAGGLVELSVANVPNGKFEVQLILTYDA